MGPAADGPTTSNGAILSDLQPRSSSPATNSTAIIAGGIVGTVVLICLVVAIVVPLARRRRRMERESMGSASLERGMPRMSSHRHEPSGADGLSPLLVSPLRWHENPSSSGDQVDRVEEVQIDDVRPDSVKATEDGNRAPSETVPLMIPELNFTDSVFLEDLRLHQKILVEAESGPLGVPSTTTRSPGIFSVKRSSPRRSATHNSSITSSSEYSQPSASVHTHQQIAGSSRPPSKSKSTESHRRPSSSSEHKTIRSPSTRQIIPPPPQSPPPTPPANSRNKTLTRAKVSARARAPMAPLMESDTSASPQSPNAESTPGAWWTTDPAQSHLRKQSNTPLSVLTSAFRTSLRSLSTAAPSRSSVAMSTSSTLQRYPSIAASSATYLTAPQSELGDAEFFASRTSLASASTVTRPSGASPPPLPVSVPVSVPAPAPVSIRSTQDNTRAAPYPNRRERVQAVERASRGSEPRTSSSSSAPTITLDADRPRRAHLRDPDAVRVRVEPRRQRGQEQPLRHKRGDIEVVRHNYAMGAPVQ